jgi:hypothetical protein
MEGVIKGRRFLTGTQQTKGRLMGFTHSAYMVLIFDLWKKPRRPLVTVGRNKPSPKTISATKVARKAKMEIAINICFGGFSLSPVGKLSYLKKKGKAAFFYRQTKYSFKEGKDEYERIDDVGNTNDLFTYTITKDLGKTITKFPDEEGLYFSDSEIERNDPDLISVIKSLGDKANSQCAKLSVVEIPDGMDWEIDEYDGNESVEEKHRSWR